MFKHLIERALLAAILAYCRGRSMGINSTVSCSEEELPTNRYLLSPAELCVGETVTAEITEEMKRVHQSFYSLLLLNIIHLIHCVISWGHAFKSIAQLEWKHKPLAMPSQIEQSRARPWCMAMLRKRPIERGPFILVNRRPRFSNGVQHTLLLFNWMVSAPATWLDILDQPAEQSGVMT